MDSLRKALSQVGEMGDIITAQNEVINKTKAELQAIESELSYPVVIRKGESLFIWPIYGRCKNSPEIW